MKRILVPCNFSACCANAIRFAADLADKTDGEVIVLTVINDVDKIGAPNRDMMENASKEAKLKFSEMIKSLMGKVNFRQVIAKGKLLPALLKCIAREEIDLVVMGTRGSRGWDQFFMGSNIEKVVRTSPVPVFAVKDNIPVNSIKNIVFPFNFETSQKQLIPKINMLQKILKAKIHVLRINTSGETGNSEIQNQLEECMKQYELENYTLNVRTDENEKDGIIHFAREINADMIAMPTHGNKDFKHLYTASISADVVNHCNILTWTCSVSSKPAHSKFLI